MASDENNIISSCENDPNFAVICLFFDKFAKYLNIMHPNIKRLQEMLENNEEVEKPLKDLHIKLLRKLRKTVHETAWETALCKFCWGFGAHDAWEIEKFGYKKASIKIKLRVLRELVESQFERNGKFRSITEKMTASEMRSEPIGRDKLGHAYWIAQDPDCNIRIYQEHSDEEIWQVVAKSREELVTLISRLKGNEVVLPSIIGSIDEDSSSNSCLVPPVKTEILDDKNIKIENEQKVPNIKIKLPSENLKTGETSQPEIIKTKEFIKDNTKEKSIKENESKMIKEEFIEIKSESKDDSTKVKKLVEKQIDSIVDKKVIKQENVKSNVKQINVINSTNKPSLKCKPVTKFDSASIKEEEFEEEESEEDFDEDEGEEEEESDEGEEEETEEEEEDKDKSKLNKINSIIKSDKNDSKPKNSNDSKIESKNNNQIDDARKVKPLVISQSKLTSSPVPVEESKVGNKSLTVPKKRPLEIENKEKDSFIPFAKRVRPTLLDAKRSKNVSKYEMFNNASDDENDEEDEEEEEEEEEGEEEDDEEEEGDDDDDDIGEETEDEEDNKKEPEVSEAIEEKVLVVKGEGNGKDCEGSLADFLNLNLNLVDNDRNFFSEVIEEEVFYVYGEGSGKECLVGNPPENEPKEEISNKSLEEDECLNLTNKIKKNIENNSTLESSKLNVSNDENKALNKTHDKKIDNSIEKSEKDNKDKNNVIVEDNTLAVKKSNDEKISDDIKEEKLLIDGKNKSLNPLDCEKPNIVSLNHENIEKNACSDNLDDKEKGNSESNSTTTKNSIENHVENKKIESSKTDSIPDSISKEKDEANLKVNLKEKNIEKESQNDSKVIQSKSKEIPNKNKTSACRKRRLIEEQKTRPISESETDFNSENLEDFEEEIVNDEYFDMIGGKRPKMRNKIVNTSMRKKIEAQREDVDTTSSSGSGSEEEKPRKKITPKKQSSPKNNDKDDISSEKVTESSLIVPAPVKENDSTFKWKKKLSSNKLDAKIASLKEAKEKVFKDESKQKPNEKNGNESSDDHKISQPSSIIPSDKSDLKEEPQTIISATKNDEKDKTRKRSSPPKTVESNNKSLNKNGSNNKNNISVIRSKSKITESDEEIPRKRTISEDASASVENKKDIEITTDEEKHCFRKRAITDEKSKHGEKDDIENCPKKRTVNQPVLINKPKESPKPKLGPKSFKMANRLIKNEEFLRIEKVESLSVDSGKRTLVPIDIPPPKNKVFVDSEQETDSKLNIEIPPSENLMVLNNPAEQKIKIVVKTYSDKNKKGSNSIVTPAVPKRRGRSNIINQQSTPIGKKPKTEEIKKIVKEKLDEDPLKITPEKEIPRKTPKTKVKEATEKVEIKKEIIIRKPRKREIDTSNIIIPDPDSTPMRQSRRIAQLKIREEAERRKLEEIALKKMKDDLRKRKKEEKQLMNDPTVSEPSSESSDSEKSSKKKFEKMKKKVKGKEGWSSGNSDEEEHDIDEDDLFRYPPSDHGSPLFKSDHEFSPESDIEDESQIVPLKRARTVRKEGDVAEPKASDEACQKCGKGDHPEWILLCDKCDKGYHCSCLSPVLFIIPEGNWFCPPCQQEQLIKALENHLKVFDELVIKRKEEEVEAEQVRIAELAAEERKRELELEEEENRKSRKSENKKKKSATGSSKTNLKKENGSGNSEDSFRSSEAECSDDEVIKKTKRQKISEKNRNGRRKSSGSSLSNSNSSSSGSTSATDSDDEPIYKLRKRRQANISYNFNEYDELINSAIKKDVNADAGAGNLGRGKDISTIIEADKDENTKTNKFEDTPIMDDKKSQRDEKENNTLKNKSKSDSDSDFQPAKSKSNRRSLKKKSKKLNCLEVSSDDDGSDEDFKTSSEDDDEEDEYLSFDSDSSLEMYRRKNKHGKKKTRRAARRTARERKKVKDFVVEDSEIDSDEDKPKIKKKRKKHDSDYTETEDTDESIEDEEDLNSDELCDDSTSSSDGNWKPGKRKKQNSTKSNKKAPAGKEPASSKAVKKVKKIEEEDEPPPYVVKTGGGGIGVAKKKFAVFDDTSDETTDSDSEAARKTRGRRLFYMDDYEDEDSSDSGIKPGVKRPDTPPEEREKFIKQQEEIKKRMQAEKEAKAKADAAVAGKEPEKAGSLSTVPLSVIRAAKALDVDYLQRKGEPTNEDAEDEEDDEAVAAAAFGDALPDDFNPDDMDEESIAKMMEEEDYAQNQLQFPPATEILNKPRKGTTPIKVGTAEISQPALPVGSSSVSVIQDPTRKRLPMPTFNPLMRPNQIPSSHPLLQNALTNSGNSSHVNEVDDQSKPRGRRKKITPLRDPVEKAAAAAAVTSSSLSKLSAPVTPPENEKIKEPETRPNPPPLSRVPNPDLNVAQPPQLYKPPVDVPQPSVITRMPQLPPRPRYPDQGSRYFAPQHPSNHSRIPPTLRHPMPPPHHTLRPSFAGGPPPLRSNLPPPNNSPISLVNNRPLLPPNGSPVNLGNRNNVPHSRGPSDILRPQTPPSNSLSKNRQIPLPPSSISNNIRPNRSGPPNITAVNLGIGRSLGPRQPPPFTPDQYSGHRSRPPPHLGPYRPPIFGAPGYPPPPTSQHPGLPFSLGPGGPMGHSSSQNPHGLLPPGSQGNSGLSISAISSGSARHPSQHISSAGPPISRAQIISAITAGTPGPPRLSGPPRSHGPPNISILPGPLRLPLSQSHLGPPNSSGSARLLGPPNSSGSARLLGPPNSSGSARLLGPPIPTGSRDSHGPPAGYYPPPIGHHLLPLVSSPVSTAAVPSSVIVSTSKASNLILTSTSTPPSPTVSLTKAPPPTPSSLPPPPQSLPSTPPTAQTAPSPSAVTSKRNTLETFDSKEAAAPIDLHHRDNEEEHNDPPPSVSVPTSSTSEFSGLVSYFSSQHDDFNT